MKIDLLTSLYVFTLAAFIGFEVIKRITPLLHTPLMSTTNALDAIPVVGAIILAGEHKTTLAAILGTIAIASATRQHRARIERRWRPLIRCLKSHDPGQYWAVLELLKYN